MDRAEMKVNAKEIINFTNDARKKYMEALDRYEKGEFNKAEFLINEANDYMDVAEKLKNQILQLDENEEKVPEIFMMVNAQDRLESTMLLRDLTKHFINLYKKVLKNNL